MSFPITTSNWKANIRSNISHATETPTHLFVAGIATVSTFTFTVIASYPIFAVNTLTADPTQVGQLIVISTTELYQMNHIITIPLIILYSLITGIATSNILTDIRTQTHAYTSLTGVIPGILATGCAGCGTGILALIGVTGGVATLPWGGNFIRITGILFFSVYLTQHTPKNTCSI